MPTFKSLEELQAFMLKNTFVVESCDYVAGKSGSKSLAWLPMWEWRYTQEQVARLAN